MDKFARFLIEELMTKTATNMLVALISVRYPAQVEWAEQKEFLVELHAKVTNLAVARMRSDGAKLQPFPRQSFEQKQQNLAIIAASNNNIFEFERNAERERSDPSNYSKDSSTNTASVQLSAGYLHSMYCFGSSDKPGCSFDGRKDQTLYSK